LGSPFYCHYNAEIFGTTQTFLELFLAIFLVILCRTMFVGSSQRRVQQRTKEGIAASRARITNRKAILGRNVVRADALVAPLDVIDDIIQTYH
jgi:hypothetical protein